MYKESTQKYVLKKSKQAGFVLSFSVLIAGVLLSIGLAIFSITLKELLLSSGGRESQFAFYAADSGGECALYWDIKHPGYSGSVFAPVVSTASTSVPMNGLVGYWDLDEGSGNVARDSSGNGNTGVLQNMEENDWVEGNINSALSFDGNNEYVNIGSGSSLHPDDAITVAAWVFNEGGDDGHIVNMGGGWNDNGYSLFWYNNSIRVELQNNRQKTILDNPAPSTGSWHHVAFTWDTDSNIVRTYIDGSVAFSTETFNGPIGTPSEGLNIGRKEGNGWYFEGMVDEVYIYDRALDGNEIATLYNPETEVVNRYAKPVPPESEIMCNNEDISDPSTGWVKSPSVPDIPEHGGWYFETGGNATTTVFDMAFENGSCATISVRKSPTQTRIDSLGYNTCDTSNPRRVERGLRITY